MDDSTKDGGPAFLNLQAVKVWNGDRHEERPEKGYYLHNGMSLLDYFAAHAPFPIEGDEYADASNRYHWARAMLAERSKP